MELAEAFARLQSERELAERFVEDPQAVLQIMGVNTTNLVIQPTVGGKEPFKSAARLRAEAPAMQAGLTVCASVGVIVCASVGGEIDLDDILAPIPLPPIRA